MKIAEEKIPIGRAARRTTISSRSSDAGPRHAHARRPSAPKNITVHDIGGCPCCADRNDTPRPTPHHVSPRPGTRSGRTMTAVPGASSIRRQSHTGSRRPVAWAGRGHRAEIMGSWRRSPGRMPARRGSAGEPGTWGGSCCNGGTALMKAPDGHPTAPGPVFTAPTRAGRILVSASPAGDWTIALRGRSRSVVGSNEPASRERRCPRHETGPCEP